MDDREYSLEPLGAEDAEFWEMIMDGLVAAGKAVKFPSGGGYREKRKGGWSDTWNDSLVQYAHQNHEETREFLEQKGPAFYVNARQSDCAFLNEFRFTEWQNVDNQAIETLEPDDVERIKSPGNEEEEYAALVERKSIGADINRNRVENNFINKRISKRLILGRDSKGRFNGQNERVSVKSIAIKANDQRLGSVLVFADVDKARKKTPRGAIARIETSPGRFLYAIYSKDAKNRRGIRTGDKRFQAIAKRSGEYVLQLYDHRTGAERKVEILSKPGTKQRQIAEAFKAEFDRAKGQ